MASHLKVKLNHEEGEKVHERYVSSGYSQTLLFLLVGLVLFFRLQPDHSLCKQCSLKGKKTSDKRKDIHCAICCWTMDVCAHTYCELLCHCKLRYSKITFDFLRTQTGRTKSSCTLLMMKGKLFESVIGINKDDIDEEDDESSTMEPPSRNEAIKAAITLNNFLLSYEKTTPEVLTMLRKIETDSRGN
ncbi:hypothetical protein Tco_0644849 [Tanacetum coccineum]